MIQDERIAAYSHAYFPFRVSFMAKKKPKTVSMLQMNLIRDFFAKVASGEKKIEYRDQTDYWKVRLEGRKYDVIRFRNGYATKAPEMLVKFLGVKKIVRQGDPLYAISLGKVLEIKRWKA